MRLILVRHGRTVANVMQALDTDFPGNPLDDVGRREADGLPARLEEAGLIEALGSLWVSPILRARQTIAPIEAATGLSATIDSGLREVLAAELEMNTDARSVACYVDTTRAWMAGRPACRIPGSPEDGTDTLQRFDDAVGRIAEQTARAGASAALLVSHGTVLRLWTSLKAAPGSGVDPLWIADRPMHNTGITVVDGDPESGWSLTSWDDGAWGEPSGAAAMSL